MPGRDLPEVNIVNIDKVAHLIVYGILSGLAFRGFMQSQPKSARELWLALSLLLVFCGAYGFLIEVLQEKLTSDRHFDLYDALANLAGAIGGLIFSFLFYKRAGRINLN